MTALVERAGNLSLPQVDQGAILKHLGINPNDPASQALILVCQRYDLDPILKHALLIKGRLYVTRDGLMHIAHRSGVFDGMEVLEQGESNTHYTAKVSVWRRDMSRAFTYIGRYPKSGQIAKDYGPEMAVKVAEVMGLRRAFDVALGAVEERWDEVGQAEIQAAQQDARQPRSADVTREVAQAAGAELRQAPANADALAAWKVKLGKVGKRLGELGARDEATAIMARWPKWNTDVDYAIAAYNELMTLGESLPSKKSSESEVVEAEVVTVTLITDKQRKALMGQLGRLKLPNTTEARSAFYSWLVGTADNTRTNDLDGDTAQGLIDTLEAMDPSEVEATAAEFKQAARL